MAYSFAEEAFHSAMAAAYAMEKAARGHGPTSEEARLARRAYEHFMEDYKELSMGEKKCSCNWPGDKLYDC